MAKKKKYYQNKKDRMDESRGMKKKVSKKGNDDYGLIDYSATANLPQDVKIMYYKQDDYGMYGEYKDSSTEMEKQANDDRRIAIKSKPKSRY